MFDLLKKKISSFTQKVKHVVSQKKVEEQPKSETAPEQPKEIIQEHIEQVVEEKKEEKIIKEKPIEAESEKRELKAQVRVTEQIKSVFTGEIELTQKDVENLLSELELSLLEADVEQQTAEHIVKELSTKLIGQKLSNKNLQEQLKQKIKDTLLLTMNFTHINLLEKISQKKPYVILFLGPNGVGKTTTIAKLVHFLQEKKLKVILSASDTFRAASIEQLKTHAQKLDTRIVSHTYGADPTAVAFDALKAAQANKLDVVLIDTAGRQETNKNLIQELKKMHRVIQPDLKIFIAEALSGQALLTQAKEFDKEIGIDAFILTKLDADPKGGTIISLIYNLKKPVLFIGTGQEYSDLEEFDAKKIVEKIV